jgi:hypothetical protein
MSKASDVHHQNLTNAVRAAGWRLRPPEQPPSFGAPRRGLRGFHPEPRVGNRARSRRSEQQKCPGFCWQSKLQEEELVRVCPVASLPAVGPVKKGAVRFFVPA